MRNEAAKKPRRVSDQEVRETILDMARTAGTDGSVRPGDVARTILPDHWRTLLNRIRIISRQLAHEGKLTILRKGQPANPDDFKGLYRLQITEAGLTEQEDE